MSRVVSSQPMIPFNVFTFDMVVSAEPRAPTGPRMPQNMEHEDWELAWMQRKIPQPTLIHGAAREREVAATHAAAAAREEPAAVDDADHEDELEEARAVVHDAEQDGEHDLFYVSVLGSQWTAAHRHMAWDAISGRARGGIPVMFCKHYGLQLSMRFARSIYGIDNCVTLAQAFCRRLSFLPMVV